MRMRWLAVLMLSLAMATPVVAQGPGEKGKPQTEKEKEKEKEKERSKPQSQGFAPLVSESHSLCKKPLTPNLRYAYHPQPWNKPWKPSR